MNKKNTRKGFTIVELVIVIAVIAILATVLVPTFGNVISDAQKTALLQEIKNEYTSYTVKYASEAGFTDNLLILIEGTYYKIENGSVAMSTTDKKAPATVAAADIGDAVVYDTATDLVVHAFVDEYTNGTETKTADNKCDDCGLATGGTAHKS